VWPRKADSSLLCVSRVALPNTPCFLEFVRRFVFRGSTCSQECIALLSSRHSSIKSIGLTAFFAVRPKVEPGGVIHTDGLLGYLPLEKKAYEHEVTFLRDKKKILSGLMPRVHRVLSLLERWLKGTPSERRQP